MLNFRSTFVYCILSKIAHIFFFISCAFRRCSLIYSHVGSAFRTRSIVHSYQISNLTLHVSHNGLCVLLFAQAVWWSDLHCPFVLMIFLHENQN